MNIPPRVLTIMQEEAEAARISVADLRSNSRLRKITEPRQRAMWRCRNEIEVAGAPASLNMIGRWFGRDHTTVINAIRRVGNHELPAVRHAGIG